MQGELPCSMLPGGHFMALGLWMKGCGLILFGSSEPTVGWLKVFRFDGSRFLVVQKVA